MSCRRFRVAASHGVFITIRCRPVLRPRSMVSVAVNRVVARVFVAGAFVLGCGGASSETPPPLSPDPLHDPYRPQSVRQNRAGSVKASASAESTELDPSVTPPANQPSATDTEPAAE